MKRLIVMCAALALALAPSATAEAAKGGKSKGAAKTCVVKKAKKASKGKSKKAKKACGKKKAKKVVKKAAPSPAATVVAQKDCRADRRLDPEGFAEDFGTGDAAVAKCAAELVAEQKAGDDAEDLPLDEPLEDEPIESEADPAPFAPESDDLGEDEEIV